MPLYYRKPYAGTLKFGIGMQMLEHGKQFMGIIHIKASTNVHDLQCNVHDPECNVHEPECNVQGLQCNVQGLQCNVQGL